jgi:hypothetical protein
VSEDRLRIVVLGYLVRGPIGGMAWASNLNYLAGLAALGHDVYLLEDSADEPWACWDPELGMIDAEPRYGLEYASRALATIGAEDRWAYYDAPRGCWHGPLADRMLGICRTADLLLDVGGISGSRAWTREIPKRALVDCDPVFKQVAHLTNPGHADVRQRYTNFFTLARNFGSHRCTVPDDGLPWKPTLLPTFLPAWPVSPTANHGALTTIMQWESYRAVEHRGTRYALKRESFEPYLRLPEFVNQRLELVIGGGAPHELLSANGWVLCDPLVVSATPESYREYIQRSKGEFTVAKHGYVISHSGWFSERSAAYLASGRPVITEETGFSDWLPSGQGVVSFSTLEEAVAAIEEVDAHYARHCGAARELAEAFFDSRVVLGDLLESIFSGQSGSPAVVAAST